ncbi:4-hydroxybenzoate octaprenyltransferase [Halieaceae bacterium IMCC8485]|jgi:4-hydroxybenzoate polyprenyltransferase|uniref:4-hydroxybenzoate octaprenyltransferase n=1 Tax=Candidatus Seongchinamella marina TaxID=2518990 RepID=A0ABT3SUH1_9GAMM|nr:4-hydroxybenzoate octaprenyltransferase [Candidatus Seongchinamella marina]MBT3409596.1 4-hydroxybenzoate octaprenyltransferase [Halieaceae bacterium]MBT5005469.1 4-hydroxybenzoate octaprenyltransferase [Halieaceae bacterium]MCX2973631.1 4-hydroxybenzoate octaprenyltransferase [Candidatus Seongchinamella marina]
MLAQPKFQALLQLIRFDKPIGTLLLLWPTLWALWIAADGMPDWDLLIIFTLGTFLMRSAGCVINDLADRHWDGDVGRTSQRPLVTGAVSATEARLLFIGLLAAAFVLVLFTNPLTVKLSFIAVALASTYPFMKRYTNLPQVVLGAAFSWSIPMAFAAQTGDLPANLWLLYLANLLWTMAYDTKYAMVDREDDLTVGIKSTAILFGQHDRLIIGLLQTTFLILMVIAGDRFSLHMPYYAALVGAAALCVYHQYLIRERERDACFKAFLHNNWVGAVIFAGLVLNFAL